MCNLHGYSVAILIQVGSAVVTLKNAVIGSQKQKDTIIEQGVLARLIHLLVDPEIPTKIKTDVVYILGSITNGSEANLKSLNDIDVVAILVNGLVSQDEKLVQASLCCLRSLLQSKDWRPPEEDRQAARPSQVRALALALILVPQGAQLIFSDPTLVPHLISLLGKDATHQIAVCDIFTSCCRYLRPLLHDICWLKYCYETLGRGPNGCRISAIFRISAQIMITV